jgi:hypothetical protein
MKQYWQKKPEELGEKTAPAPLCPPQIPQELDYDLRVHSNKTNSMLQAVTDKVLCN